jgi:hypothetical protein
MVLDKSNGCMGSKVGQLFDTTINFALPSLSRLPPAGLYYRDLKSSPLWQRHLLLDRYITFCTAVRRTTSPEEFMRAALLQLACEPRCDLWSSPRRGEKATNRAGSFAHWCFKLFRATFKHEQGGVKP